MCYTKLRNSGKWKKNAKASGYQIQYSPSSAFSYGKVNVNVAGGSKSSKTISKLKRGTKYYVRIRSYKKKGSKKYYSAWSPKKSVKVSR